ncbi:DUF6415 family natural product biosynthesis protein [Streptomyces qinglanensis]|uniref:DUF6415 family natural product biosynthesis protein n=1 Tax=Streptomyces qinglanensis TaxID=943816 RepID=UPI003D718D48
MTPEMQPLIEAVLALDPDAPHPSGPQVVQDAAERIRAYGQDLLETLPAACRLHADPDPARQAARTCETPHRRLPVEAPADPRRAIRHAQNLARIVQALARTAHEVQAASSQTQQPDLDRARAIIRAVASCRYPSAPSWARGAEELHRLAEELLPHVGAAQYGAQQIRYLAERVQATLHERPPMAEVEYVTLLAGQLSDLIRLLRQGPVARLVDAVARDVACGILEPGDRLVRSKMSDTYDATPDSVARAVRLLVATGVLELDASRPRVPAPPSGPSPVYGPSDEGSSG